MKAWISAIRPRTLPLTLSCIAIGSALAFHFGTIHPNLVMLSLATATFLQILSNLANDYGDYTKGTDNQNRIGPERAVQSGKITPKQMKNAIITMVILSLISGIALLWEAAQTLSEKEILVFFGLGILSIIAAITYTVGKKAYGYYGLGDVMVFLFFGWLGVGGSYYLNTHFFSPEILIPASAFGLLSVGVLNMNNIRDIENDKNCGKITIPVRLGFKKSKIYHLIVTSLAIALGWIYLILFYQGTLSWLYFFTIFPFFILLKRIFKSQENREFDFFLKLTALASLLWSMMYCLILTIH